LTPESCRSRPTVPGVNTRQPAMTRHSRHAELREALLQIGAYAGFSAAHEALDVLSEIVTPG
jgi:alkylhydroperoxidase/carboxymuconolactone decarboxylase family protein YurZ